MWTKKTFSQIVCRKQMRKLCRIGMSMFEKKIHKNIQDKMAAVLHWKICQHFRL